MDVLARVGATALRRVKEPSTWAGSGVLAVVASHYLGPELGGHVIELGASIGAILSILVPEKHA
jgi:hypothetical protein